MRKDPQSRQPLTLSRETLADLAPSTEQTLAIRGGGLTTIAGVMLLVKCLLKSGTIAETKPNNAYTAVYDPSFITAVPKIHQD